MLCDYCDKCFCYVCITRLSGKEYLQYLLKSETTFECYICDPSCLKNAQKLCCELIDRKRHRAGGIERKLSSHKESYVIPSCKPGKKDHSLELELEKLDEESDDVSVSLSLTPDASCEFEFEPPLRKTPKIHLTRCANFKTNSRKTRTKKKETHAKKGRNSKARQEETHAKEVSRSMRLKQGELRFLEDIEEGTSIAHVHIIRPLKKCNSLPQLRFAGGSAKCEQQAQVLIKEKFKRKAKQWKSCYNTIN